MFRQLSKSLSGIRYTPFQKIGSSLLYKSTFSYIRKTQLDEIQKAHGTSNFQKLLMYSKQGRHIYMEGWKTLKIDISDYMNLLKNQSQLGYELSQKQIKLKERMRHQLNRMKTIIIIQILPFSGPILLYYLYTYPTSIPSWFCIDTLHDDYLRDCIKKQKEAIQYFKLHPINKDEFQISKLNIEELKTLSQLLFGHFEDGIHGYNKIIKQNKKDYLFHPNFSKHLLIRNIKKQFNQHIRCDLKLQNLSFNQQVIWKYEKVMNGELLIQFTPLCEENQNNQCQNKQKQEVADKQQAKQQTSVNSSQKVKNKTTGHSSKAQKHVK